MNYALPEMLCECLSRTVSPINQQHVHHFISRWYCRLLMSSADPRAAFAVVSPALTALEIWIGSGAPDREMDASIIVMLRHSRIVLKTAEEQLKRRLSEELTAQY